MQKRFFAKFVSKLLMVQVLSWAMFSFTAQAGFFKDRILKPLLGKSNYERCDTEKFDFEEESFGDLWKKYNKYVKRSKYCEAAKTLVRIYLQHPEDFNERNGFVLVLKNLEHGNFFLDFAWEYKNFKKRYPGNVHQEFVDTLRLRTYFPYLPSKTRGYCIRPQGYFEDAKKQLLPLTTEARMVANQFMKDWPESSYKAVAENLLKEARIADAEYLICTAKAKVGNWKRLPRKKKTPGPLLSAYRDLGSVIGAYQDLQATLPEAMLEMVKVLHMIKEHPTNQLDPQFEYIAKEDWSKKGIELQMLLERHFPRAKETKKARKYSF